MNGDNAMTTVTGPVTGPPRAPARLTMTPGRRVTLAIGVPIALALIGLSALSFVSNIGMASFQVNRTIPLEHGRLVANANGGDLTVRKGGAGGASADTAQLTGTVQYSMVRPDFSVSGSDGINLHCRYLFGNCQLNAVLSVPPGTALDLASGGGNMQVGGIQSAVTLTSDGGEISLSGSRSAAIVDSGGGNVSVSDLGGVLKFITSGGNVNGNSLTSPNVTMDSGGGNVSLTFTTPPASLSVTSSGGNVTIVLPHDATQYAVTVVPDGGDYQPSRSVPLNPSATDTIIVKSGGGNVSIVEPS
jgi:hypothetical protein